MKEIAIRLARTADLPDILSMIRALSAFHGDEASTTLELLQDRMFGPRARATAFIAERQGRMAGYAAMTHLVGLHEAAPRGDIQHLYVSEACRGTGIGRALITAVAKWAAAQGVATLTIGTDPANTSAQAAYRAMGLDEITNPGPRFRVPPGWVG